MQMYQSKYMIRFIQYVIIAEGKENVPIQSVSFN